MESKITNAALIYASQWYARLESPDCTPEELVLFKDWLAHPENADAYAQVASFSEAFARHAQSDPCLQRLAEEALADKLTEDSLDSENLTKKR